MRVARYEDPDGRKWRVALPEEAPDSELAKGIRLCPRDSSGLDLPPVLAVAVHNALFDRHICSREVAQANPAEVGRAFAAAMKVSGQRLIALWAEEDEAAILPTD